MTRPPFITFLEPLYLWLLVLPAILFAVWIWQLTLRRGDARRYLNGRTLPVREHYSFTGGLSFWLCLGLSVTSLIFALARPQALVTLVRPGGVDFVVLLDGSTSMRVTDVSPDRWQRSTAWLRTFAETVGWTNERVAVALFAYRPAPQIRLTRDPNAFFFFLDYLGNEPPFRLEDDTSWDTNIEEGIFWGVKMIDVDENLYGRRRSAKAFVVVSDGQAWSGEVSKALELARSRGIRVYVVGVGTSAGGLIPDVPPRRYERRPPPIHSAIDRRSLRAIAEAGGGKYYELGTQAGPARGASNPLGCATVCPTDAERRGLCGAVLGVSRGRCRIRLCRNGPHQGAHATLVAACKRFRSPVRAGGDDLTVCRGVSSQRRSYSTPSSSRSLARRRRRYRTKNPPAMANSTRFIPASIGSPPCYPPLGEPGRNRRRSN